MDVSLLTTEQKDLLVGQKYNLITYFNPIEDIDENWIIGPIEREYCVVEEFLWVKTLPLIKWIPPIIPPPIPLHE